MEPSKSNNTETEEETTALKRKRLRRVSFADNEITSVHIFRRDDDHSTSTSSSSEPPLDPVLGLFRDLAGESDEDDDNRLRNRTDDGHDHINSFLQPIGSPSPGGSTTTAAEDTDDDDFRGPVSSDFIRPERSSDSGVSDDITMDSTAFSLHYRSIARSDSGDLKTPTRFGASASSTGRSSGSPGSFMELTVGEKKEFQVPAGVVASGGGDSDDMSIEGEYPKSYNYGKLSPRLVAILAQASDDLRCVSPSKVTCSPITNYMEPLPNLERSVTSPVQPITLVPTVAAASESSTKNTKEFDNDATVPARKQLEFANTNKGTPPKMDEGDQLDLAAKFELDFSEGQVKESNFEDIGQVSDSNRKSDQVTGSPLHGSGSTPLSFSARKLVFVGSPDSPKCTGNTTPPLKQSGSFGPEVPVTPSEALSSIRKSILKLKTLENSSTATLKEGVSSKLRTLETSPTATPKEATGLKLRTLENSPISTLKERINSKLKALETPTSLLKEGIDKLKHRLSAYSPGASFFNEKDCEYKQIETLTSPLEDQLFSLAPGNNTHQGLINTDDHGIDSFRYVSKVTQNEETMATKKDEERFNLVSGDVSYIDENPKPVEIAASPLLNNHITRVVDFTPADSTVEKRKDEILAAMHVKPFSSPVKPFDQNLLPPIECQSNCQGELKQLDKQNASVNSGLGEAIDYNTQTMSNGLELSGFNDEQPSSSFEAAQVDEFAKSASKGKPAESPNRFLVSRSPIQAATMLPPSLHVLPSELHHNNIQDLSLPGNSDGHVVDLDNNYHPVLQVAQSPLTKFGIEVSSGKKRKGVEILKDGANIDKIVRINRSPEVQRSENGGLHFALDQTGHMRSERDKFGDQNQNDWDHILKTFSSSTKQLHSPSVDKLNLRMIGMLEDILVHLQKVEKWDILSSEIQSQHKLTDPLNIPRRKRGVEMRMLLFNIAYAKAKQQLLNIKRERLLKKVQQLSSGVQETQMMTNSMPYSTKSGSIDIPVDDSCMYTRIFNSQGKCQVSCDKVMEKRQELEGLDQKAKSLSEFFFSYCKMDGDQSCTNIIKYVSDYLLKRMSYKLIFQNMKLWDIEGFERKDDYYTISLTYCGYINQRFTVNAGLSSTMVSNSLNDVTIRKTYPNMDAFIAFVFVLNTNAPKKSTGRTSMAQETQITSSLLSTLLDVTEEVQLALMEIRNLVQAKFYSPSVHQLYLQLSFIDFGSGKKVQVTLDMTCLKCGAYPLEVLPSQIYSPAATGEQTALPSSLVNEIRTVTEKVRTGYSRIIRLCRCISQAVQACTQRR